METQTDHSQLYVQLLVGSGIISRQELIDFKMIARDLNMPLIQAIMGSGSLQKRSMDIAAQAMMQVKDKKISPDLAIRALRVALNSGISLNEAIHKSQKAHRTTRVMVSATNELTNLLIDAGVLKREQLGPVLVKCNEFSSMVGQVMVLTNLISLLGLTAALNAVNMIRSCGLSKENAIKGLQHAYSQRMSLEQALFELGTFVEPDVRATSIGEIVFMAGLITESDYAECFEIHLFKDKEFGQILLERGFLSERQLDAAINLLESIASGVLLPYEASRALYMVCRENKGVYATMSEMHHRRGEKTNSRLGDLLVDASICSREQIESVISKNVDSAVRVGHTLLKSDIIGESLLYAVLRLQASVRVGYVSREAALQLAHYCFVNRISLDQAMTETSIYIPSRMQWAWV